MYSENKYKYQNTNTRNTNNVTFNVDYLLFFNTFIQPYIVPIESKINQFTFLNSNSMYISLIKADLLLSGVNDDLTFFNEMKNYNSDDELVEFKKNFSQTSISSVSTSSSLSLNSFILVEESSIDTESLSSLDSSICFEII